MKVMIPAKAGSTRVPDKNFRPFLPTGESLFDLLAEKLTNVFRPTQVYVQSEHPDVKSKADQYGFNFLQCPTHLCDNDSSQAATVTWAAQQIAGNESLMVAAVTCPFFNEYREACEKWYTTPATSLVGVYPTQEYLLDDQMQPIGFGFGKDHLKSQDLPVFHRLPFHLVIQTHSSAINGGAYAPPGCDWFKCKGFCLDIDTQEDFELAGQVYHSLRLRGKVM